MKPCNKCNFLMNNSCEIYLSLLKTDLTSTEIKNICEYFKKYPDKKNMNQICKLISREKLKFRIS